MMRNVRIYPGMALLICSISSCGGVQLVPVRGKITLDGQPLASASVVLRPVQGRPSFGLTDAQGMYSLSYAIYAGTSQGAVTGPGLVKIYPGVKSPQATKGDAETTESVANRVAVRSLRKPVQVTVLPEQNTFNFALTSNQ